MAKLSVSKKYWDSLKQFEKDYFEERANSGLDNTSMIKSRISAARKQHPEYTKIYGKGFIESEGKTYLWSGEDTKKYALVEEESSFRLSKLPFELVDLLKNNKIDWTKSSHEKEIKELTLDLELDTDIFSSALLTVKQFNPAKEKRPSWIKDYEDAKEIVKLMPEDYREYSLDVIEFFANNQELSSRYIDIDAAYELTNRILSLLKEDEFAIIPSAVGTGDLFAIESENKEDDLKASKEISVGDDKEGKLALLSDTECHSCTLEPTDISFEECLKIHDINTEEERHFFGVTSEISEGNKKFKVIEIGHDALLKEMPAFKGQNSGPDFNVSFVELIEKFKKGEIHVSGFNNSELKEFARVINGIRHCREIIELKTENALLKERLSVFELAEKVKIAQQDEEMEERNKEHLERERKEAALLDVIVAEESVKEEKKIKLDPNLVLIANLKQEMQASTSKKKRKELRDTIAGLKMLL